jgi:hypothetical protein
MSDKFEFHFIEILKKGHKNSQPYLIFSWKQYLWNNHGILKPRVQTNSHLFRNYPKQAVHFLKNLFV